MFEDVVPFLEIHRAEKGVAEIMSNALELLVIRRLATPKSWRPNVMPLSRYHKMKSHVANLTIGSSGGFDAPPSRTSGRLRPRRRLEELEQS